MSPITSLKQAAEMSDHQLVRRYEALHTRMDKMQDRLIKAGLGDMQPVQMRQQCPTHPLVMKYLALVDESVSLRMEAEHRYGPGMMLVRQLIWRKL